MAAALDEDGALAMRLTRQLAATDIETAEADYTVGVLLFMLVLYM